MKRFLFAALLVLAISAFVVMPAFAEDTCAMDPVLHQPTAQSLILHVQHASDMGHIDPLLVTSLMAPLNSAANATLTKSSRILALQGFIGLVNGQAGKGINADCAKMLVMQAQQTIAALNG